MCCMALSIVAMSASAVEASSTTDQKQPEVLVEVIYNSYDEEYLKNIPFDDGTVVGDYDYEIRYIGSVTRDPTYIPYYFNAVSWITRDDGMISLSLDPNSKVRNDSSVKDTAWSVLSTPSNGVADNRNWPTNSKNVKTFRWQYDCHFDFAKDKDRWNIEPSRTAGSYLAVVVNKCNP